MTVDHPFLLKKGDLLVYNGLVSKRPYGLLKIGEVVKVVYPSNTLGVEFPFEIDGHDCCSSGKTGHCWWVFPEFLKTFDMLNFKEWDFEI